jgi:ergothioneine biosynthesis protein EgtB
MDRDRLDESFYREVRAATERLCEPLAVEDYVVQTMPDVSPTRWHLAHTSWFFEEFALASLPGYRWFDERFRYLFNSYYETVGERHPRPERGHLSRPTVSEVLDYRHHVDEWMARAFADLPLEVVELGVNHEQQHQELILTDLKHVFATNPLRPAYQPAVPRVATPPRPARWVELAGGVMEVGDAGRAFAFDNERPRHPILLQPFALHSRLVTCGEYLEFIASGGYQRPQLWLSDGWDACRRAGWEAPLYWHRCDREWRIMTLGGMRALDSAEPVCHVSFYEADAFARWADARLPLETEWERAAATAPVSGNLVESGELHPISARDDFLAQLFGDVWEWTASAYLPYPGFRTRDGALGEYNGKFMSNRMVLRGGSCFTPASHLRATYRNFFLPDARWQMTGIRLAR